MKVVSQNAGSLEKELAWLEECIRYRVTQTANEFRQASEQVQLPDEAPAAPQHQPGDSPLAKDFLCTLTDNDRLLLALAIAPHVKPEVLDGFLLRDPYGKIFTKFGGRVNYAGFSGFFPTWETAFFLMDFDSLDKRLNTIRQLPQHPLLKTDVLKAPESPDHEPAYHALLLLHRAFRKGYLSGQVVTAQDSYMQAHKLRSELTWNDLFLEDTTAKEINNLLHWLTHRDTVLKDKRVMKYFPKGFKALFYGASGTGKTLAATLIGKHTRREVYRIDLSRIVSKYIGETEKNLAKIFERAANKDWVLFFDEADALFGKRTETKDAKDRYANQEVAYLLQAIEVHEGIVILASNYKKNIDDAFLRRFQSIAYFPVPTKATRRKIWENVFQFQTDSKTGVSLNGVDFKQLAQHELTGADIVNVFQYSVIQALEQDKHISQALIERGIKREMQKKGKRVG